MTPSRLFVYGTLRPRGRAFDLVAASVVRHQEAVLVDFALVGEGHRYPWCIEQPGAEVAGDLLWLRDVEAVLTTLDDYEGVSARNPEYRRVIAQVLTVDRQWEAWVYAGGPGVPPDAVAVSDNAWTRCDSERLRSDSGDL